LTNSLIQIEPLYVVDTHGLMWFINNDKRLGKIAAAIFEAAEDGKTTMLVSAVVIAELYWINQKWHYFPDFSQIYSMIKTKPYVQIIDFWAEDVLRFDQDATIPEMHDRIIVGLARLLDVTLITQDSKIIASNLVRTVW
jgi:PIN domain nuclease of toxin-antitoxin system